MKNFLILLFAWIAFVDISEGQSTPSFNDQLSDLWKQKKYTELQVLLDAKIAETTPDVVALYCGKVFYAFIQPNKIKAVQAATKLKQVAQGTQNTEFIAFADEELAGIQAIPDDQFGDATEEVLNALHDESPDEFFLLSLAVKLKQKYLTP